jgi:Tfp pilus assembly protein PilO
MKKNFKNINYKYLENLVDLKSKRTAQISFISFTILALIFLGLFAINPTLSTIANLRKQLSDDQFVDQQLQIKINNLSALQQSFADLSNDLPIINNAVPQSPQAPTLLAQIQAVAKQSNINLLSSQVFPVELDNTGSPNTKYGSFTFVVLGQGSKDDAVAFVESLSKMQRIVSFDQITITKKADDSTVSQISIRGSGFYKP